jgi:serpin B
MVLAGAKGVTAEELAAVMHVPGVSSSTLHAAFGALDRVLNGKGDGWELAAANRLWIAPSFPLRADYLSLTGEHYVAAVEAVDFARPARAAAAIDAWVRRITRDRIRDLVPAEAIARDTRLILTNALYLDATWSSPFEKQATTDGTFRTLAGKPAEARFMHQAGSFGLAAAHGVHALELPYRGDELSMVLVLPDDAAKFRELEATIDGGKLGEILDALAPAPVEVTMPVWTSDSSMKLGDALQALGAKTAFGGGADFSGITDAKEPLVIDEVLHKTHVRVDEAGTEAAAATAVLMKRGAMPPQDGYAFTADRPFLYLIRHRPTGAVLFFGRLADPT